MATELGPFYVEVKTHGMEAITMQVSDASVQQGESISGGTLTETDEFQAMDLDGVVIVDPFGMSLTESSTARRWWTIYDIGVLGQELGSTLCGQG